MSTTDARRAASVALLRAMDREPRSYLIELLRAYHAGAEREALGGFASQPGGILGENWPKPPSTERDELGELLREAFGPPTSAKVAP